MPCLRFIYLCLATAAGLACGGRGRSLGVNAGTPMLEDAGASDGFAATGTAARDAPPEPSRDSSPQDESILSTAPDAPAAPGRDAPIDLPAIGRPLDAADASAFDAPTDRSGAGPCGTQPCPPAVHWRVALSIDIAPTSQASNFDFRALTVLDNGRLVAAIHNRGGPLILGASPPVAYFPTYGYGGMTLISFTPEGGYLWMAPPRTGTIGIPGSSAPHLWPLADARFRMHAPDLGTGTTRWLTFDGKGLQTDNRLACCQDCCAGLDAPIAATSVNERSERAVVGRWRDGSAYVALQDPEGGLLWKRTLDGVFLQPAGLAGLLPDAVAFGPGSSIWVLGVAVTDGEAHHIIEVDHAGTLVRPPRVQGDAGVGAGPFSWRGQSLRFPQRDDLAAAPTGEVVLFAAEDPMWDGPTLRFFGTDGTVGRRHRLPVGSSLPVAFPGGLATVVTPGPTSGVLTSSIVTIESGGRTRTLTVPGGITAAARLQSDLAIAGNDAHPNGFISRVSP